MLLGRALGTPGSGAQLWQEVCPLWLVSHLLELVPLAQLSQLCLLLPLCHLPHVRSVLVVHQLSRSLHLLSRLRQWLLRLRPHVLLPHFLCPHQQCQWARLLHERLRP